MTTETLAAAARNYTTLSLADLAAEFEAMARDAGAVFGSLSGPQLNWKPDERRWSVAQCFDHLLTANAKMFDSMEAAIQNPRSRTIWQQLPVLPRIYGALLINSQAPEGKRRFTAPREAQPSASAIDERIIHRFIASQREAAERTRSIEVGAAQLIMVSPFLSFITYSVLDGCRLIAAHQRRHFEQARRVTQEPGFPPYRL